MAHIKSYKGKLPRIDETVYMDETACVYGDVVIGPEASFWCNAVARGDVHYIKIGARTNVQDNSVLHVTNDTYPLNIGEDVTIGHSVTLHGCTIGDRCLIGMGAVVLDNAVIGEDSIVAAGALVTEGMIVPPGSLVMGMPARIKRETTLEERAHNLRSASNYIEYSNNYRGR